MKNWRVNRKAEGIVSLELAIVLPVLFLLLIAIVEFTYAYQQLIKLNTLQRSAGRYLSANLPPGPNQIVDLTTADALEKIDIAKQLIIKGTTDTEATGDTLMKGLTASDITVANSDDDHIIITTVYAFQPLFGRMTIPEMFTSSTISLDYNLPASLSFRAVGS